MNDRDTLPIKAEERRQMAFLMRFWVLCPYQEPLASEVAKFLDKICRMAVAKFFPSCSFEDRYDLAMDMFRAMWANLPEVYDPERCPDEVNVMWLLNRCRMYATGQWSTGYGNIGCKYTRAKWQKEQWKKDWVAELCLQDSLDRPDAHPHRVTAEKPQF